jgi:hypothetical protein
MSDKLRRDKIKPVVVLGSEKLKADISVADGELFCLRLINWVANYCLLLSLGLDTGPG